MSFGYFRWGSHVFHICHRGRIASCGLADAGRVWLLGGGLRLMFPARGGLAPGVSQSVRKQMAPLALFVVAVSVDHGISVALFAV